MAAAPATAEGDFEPRLLAMATTITISGGPKMRVTYPAGSIASQNSVRASPGWRFSPQYAPVTRAANRFTKKAAAPQIRPLTRLP